MIFTHVYKKHDALPRNGSFSGAVFQLYKVRSAVVIMARISLHIQTQFVNAPNAMQAI